MEKKERYEYTAMAKSEQKRREQLKKERRKAKPAVGATNYDFQLTKAARKHQKKMRAARMKRRRSMISTPPMEESIGLIPISLPSNEESPAPQIDNDVKEAQPCS